MSEISATNWADTENQIIGISNAEELAKLAELTNVGNDTTNRTFVLTSDIDLSSIDNWTPIGIGTSDIDKFKGSFDGNGYTISNLTINTTNKYQGLFGYTYIATIKNTNVNNISINGGTYVGGIIGAFMGGEIINCTSSGTITGLSNIGGICGELNNANAKNCSSSVDITGMNIIGGIAGSNYSISQKNVENCYVNGNLKSNVNAQAVGLIVGYLGQKDTNKLSIVNCYADKSVVGNYYTAGNDTEEKFITKDSKTNPFALQEIQIKTNLQVGIHSDDTSVISVDTGFSLGDFNVSVLNEFSARNSLDKIDAMMNKVMAKMTEIGATQSRLENIMEYQEVQRISLTSANSHIKDADIAKEASDFIKNQILQQTTSAFLATANSNPSIALQLI